MPDVRLVDLDFVRRYSLALRQEHAPAEELLAALEASREQVLAAMRRSTRREAARVRRSRGMAMSASSSEAGPGDLSSPR
jgi:hypothetical protein